MKLHTRALLVMATSFACIGCDQATKFAARSLLSASEPKSYFGDMLRLQLTSNYGAFLSWGEGLPPAVLSVGVACVLALVLWHALAARSARLGWVLAMALLVGGGASNLLDRLRHLGYVIDFINVGVGPVRTGIFNFADVAIMTGVALLVFSRLRDRDARPHD